MARREAAHYLDLPGAVDSPPEFTPARWKRQDLFGGGAVTCRVSGIEFDLDDASVADIGLRLKNDAQRTLLERARGPLPFRVMAEGVEIAGHARTTAPIRPDDRRVRLRLVDTAFDIGAIRRQGAEARLNRALAAGDAIQPYVPARYAEQCGRFVQRLRALRAILAEEEAVPRPEEAREHLVRQAEARMYDAFLDLWMTASAITRPLPRLDPRFHAIKRFTESLVCPELADGPMWRRALEKPLGYPGDFRVMDHAYERFPRSGTLYGDAVDRLIANRMGGCVRERMVHTRDTVIRALGAKGPGTGPLRVASIGSGSARELDEMLAAPVDRPLEITLVEQDAQALQSVYERVYRAVAQRPGGAELRTLNASFVDLLRDGRLYSGFEPQDAIYSLGLIDYFNQPTARRVTRGFYDKLRPGGVLILCNMRDFEGSAFWPLEFLCDWKLEYRNEADMRDLARGLEAATVDLAVEPTGLVWMLTVTKPG